MNIRRSAITATLSLSVLLSGLTGLTAAHATTPAADAGSAPRFAPIYMAGGTLTTAQAEEVATTASIVAGSGTQLVGHVAAMHAANPSVSVQVYVNGMYAPHASHFNESDYAHSANGGRILNKAFDIYLMDPTSSDWRTQVAASCRAALARTAADACFLDNLGVAALAVGYNGAVPIDPATHAAYTSNRWLNLTGQLAASVATLTPGKMLISNGLGSGAHYFSGPTSQLAAVSPAAMAEVFLRIPSASLTTFPKANIWKLNVDMLTSAAADGYRVLAVTKIWKTATAAQLSQWHKYTLATFMLGANSMSALCFTPTQTLEGLGTGDAWAAQPIGTPTGAYTANGAAYQRSFTAGIALVNPNTTPVTVPLPAGTFTDVDGATYTGSITMTANTGAILHTS